MINILGFLFCATIIFFAGKKLSWYGDLIAEKTGMGKAWVGLILMASVTSLPELMVGISSSAIIQSADLAVGDILGSCTINLAILAILDIFVPNKQHLFYVASSGRHILSASLGIILISLAGLSIYLPNEMILLPGIGVMSVVFLIIYLISIRTIYRFDLAMKANEGFIEQIRKDLPPLRKLVTSYALFALITITAAMFIPYFAENIAVATGLGNTFVGTFFVAASTSLPEIAVSIAAVRFGSVDLAVGNLLGSNIFNILILSIDDLFYTRGVLLKDASDIHLVSVFSGIIMTALAIAGLAYRAPQKKLLMAIDSILILLFWLGSVIFLYYLSGA